MKSESMPVSEPFSIVKSNAFDKSGSLPYILSTDKIVEQTSVRAPFNSVINH